MTGPTFNEGELWEAITGLPPHDHILEAVCNYVNASSAYADHMSDPDFEYVEPLRYEHVTLKRRAELVSATAKLQAILWLGIPR